MIVKTKKEPIACAYCRQPKPLCNSHSIPDGFFKAVSRQSNGQLIALPAGVGKIRRSQNTGKSKMLCVDCETMFNQKFDSPLTNAFKAWSMQVQNEGIGTRFRFSPNHIAQGLVSIAWRAALSNNPMYCKANFSKHDIAQLLALTNTEREQILFHCSCSIKRLTDRTPHSDGGFSQRALSELIMPVQAHTVAKKHKSSRRLGFSLVVQGFLCHVVFPRLPSKSRNRPGFLNTKITTLHAPPHDVLDYVPLKHTLVQAYGKQLNGETTIRNPEVS